MVRSVAMGTNNQLGMQAIQDPGLGMARYLIDKVLAGLQKVRKIGPNMEVKICWTPRHQRIPGNEQADGEAKKAAEGHEVNAMGPCILRKPLPKSKAAVIVTHKKAWCKVAEMQVRQSLRYKKAKSIDPSLPNVTHIITMLANLPCKHASLLVQLRTGHCLLGAYLYRIKKAETPICTACNDAPETVRHFLLDC